MLRSTGISSNFPRGIGYVLNKTTSILNRQLNGLTIGVPKESLPGEARVSLTPALVSKLKKAGAKVSVQAGAGLLSGFQDISYKEAGADIVDDKIVWKSAVITKVRPPTLAEASLIENRAIMSIIQPKQNTDLMNQFLQQKTTGLI